MGDRGSRDPSAQLPRPISEIAPTVQSKDTSRTTLVSSTKRNKHRSSKVSEKTSVDTSLSSASITLSSPEHVCPDWTASKPKGILTEHLQFARSIDWAATPLGSMSSWSPEFREVANLVMRNPHPASLFWGVSQSRVILYRSTLFFVHRA